MSDPAVSNPDKIIFPAAGLTKADLVGHYQQVAGRFLDFAAGRPLTLQRFPNGVDQKGFMQKNAGKYFPASIMRHDVSTQDGGVTHYPVIDQLDQLTYLANQGTVTFHMWTATAAKPAIPDWLVIDLDPTVGDLAGVRRATLEVGDVADELGLRGFPLATGSNGFHVWFPLDGSSSREEVALAARALGGLAAARQPDLMTLEFLKKDRLDRVFVDWLRNGPIATVVVPFSLRPKPHAPVAVPLRWEEVAEAEPDGWRLGDIDDRLAIDTALAPNSLDVEAITARAREAGVDLDTPFDRFGRS